MHNCTGVPRNLYGLCKIGFNESRGIIGRIVTRIAKMR